VLVVAGLNIAGTVDFRHDTTNDIVISRPRWTLETSVDVMRWYQMHASYFGARFQEKKDMVVVNDAFDVSPRVATLWGQYRARLHETYVRLSVRVNNNARVRLTTNTSAARYSISAVESTTEEEAVAAILGARAAIAKGVSPSGIRLSAGSSRPAPARVTSSRPPKISTGES
jgi:hypothetical protein